MRASALADVKYASLRDARRLHEIAERVRYGWEGSANAGFLISGYDEAAFYRHIGSHHVTIASLNDEIAAYLIKMPWGSREMEITRSLLSTLSDVEVDIFSIPELFWMDSVAVDPAFMRHGLASQLYRRSFEEFPTSSFVAAVVELPTPNHASMAHHQSLGFRRVGTFSAKSFCGLAPYRSQVFLRRSS